jgi:hypothetical protein
LIALAKKQKERFNAPVSFVKTVVQEAAKELGTSAPELAQDTVFVFLQFILVNDGHYAIDDFLAICAVHQRRHQIE